MEEDVIIRSKVYVYVIQSTKECKYFSDHIASFLVIGLLECTAKFPKVTIYLITSPSFTISQLFNWFYPTCAVSFPCKYETSFVTNAICLEDY